MQCPICRSKENWENVDQYRLKPEGMSLCNTCGFVTYPNLYKSKDEILKYYEDEYRAPPSIGNIYNGQRKLHYHNLFLQDVFKEWKDKKQDSPVVTDIGAAFGMFLQFIKDNFNGADLHGVELTKSFVRNAYHMYEIELDQDFDDSIQYDLISSYKSLEHIMDPDIELTRYIDSLKDDGYLYLSVPIWFRTLNNFGAGGFDIEYYYHTNHINTWNKDQFEALVKICGGEIIKADHQLYESTYLIKRNNELKTDDRTSCFQDPKEIKKSMQLVFQASEAYSLADYDIALKLWPDFPIAHIARYEHNRKKYDDMGFDKIYSEVIEFAIKSCPLEADIQFLAADICMRYNQYDKAIEHLEKAQSLRPNMPNVLGAIAHAHRALAKTTKDDKTRIMHLTQARETTKMLKEVSAQNFGEATTWIMSDNAKIPTPKEISLNG